MIVDQMPMEYVEFIVGHDILEVTEERERERTECDGRRRINETYQILFNDRDGKEMSSRIEHYTAMTKSGTIHNVHRTVDHHLTENK